jgi:tetratricopeptide (TPR) repeat protein
MLAQQGMFDEALKTFRNSLAIGEPLAAADRSNSTLQRDLSIIYGEVGVVLEEQGKLDEALEATRRGLAINTRLIAIDRSNVLWLQDQQVFISKIGGLAYKFITARRADRALEAADQAISLSAKTISLYTNRAHALMFLDRVAEARALYLQYRGEKGVSEGKSWETIVLEDFADLRKAGLAHPLMDEIEAKFSARG